jgi:phospholipid transport system substrate-binding protein
MKRLICFVLISLYLLTDVWCMLGPQQQVEEVVSSVLTVLKDQNRPVEERRSQVSDRVQKFINMTSMAQRTLGASWDKASSGQRQRFTDLFVKILEGTYLNRIHDYSGGEVVYQGERVRDDKAIVDTKFVDTDLEIPVQYKMILENGSWQVFDVVIEGVSLIRNYRSSYGEIIRRDGYNGLFALMEKKIQEMQANQ